MIILGVKCQPLRLIVFPIQDIKSQWSVDYDRKFRFVRLKSWKGQLDMRYDPGNLSYLW